MRTIGARSWRIRRGSRSANGWLAVAVLVAGWLGGDQLSAQTVRWAPEQRLTCAFEQGFGGTPSVVLRIELDGALASDAVVRVEIVGGTATLGVDYEGDRLRVIRFRPSLVDFDSTLWGIGAIDDNLAEAHETIEAEMTVSGGATLAGPSRARITLLDDETFEEGDFQECLRAGNGSSLEFSLEPGISNWEPAERRAPFDLEVHNRGSQDARNVVVRHTVPGYTQAMLEESTSGWSCPDGRGEGKECSYDLGTVAAGETVDLRFATEVEAELSSEVVIFGEATLAEGTVAGQFAGRADGDGLAVTTAPAVPNSFVQAVLSGKLTALDAFCFYIFGFPGEGEGTGLTADPTGADGAGLLGRSLNNIASGALTLYRLRDRVLRKDAGGRRALELLYEHGTELANAALADFSYVRRMGAAAGRWMPAFESLLDGSGDVLVTQQMATDFRDFFEDLYPRVSIGLRRDAQNQLRRLDPSAWVGRPAADALASFSRLECSDSVRAFCANDSRFRVEVEWEDFQGGAGLGRADALTSDSGTFWFFDEENLELVVKVLDARAINQHFWVFYGSLSNVGYRLTVTDTETGAVRVYENPSGEFASAGDTKAFPETPSSSRLSSSEGVSNADATKSTLRQPQPGVELVTAGFEPLPAKTAAGSGLCVDSETELCLTDERFRITVAWRDFQGGRGVGQAVPLTDDTGSFWFFDQANVELVIKVLDATAINDRYWVFYGALSNVEYTITVTDTATGSVVEYTNPSGVFASNGDTAAFSDN